MIKIKSQGAKLKNFSCNLNLALNRDRLLHQ